MCGVMLVSLVGCAPAQPSASTDQAPAEPAAKTSKPRFVPAADSIVTAFEFSRTGCGSEEADRFVDRHGRKPTKAVVQSRGGQLTVSLSAYQSNCSEWAGDAVRQSDTIELRAVPTSGECKTEGCIWRATWTLKGPEAKHYTFDGHPLELR